jgi:hypothetical protein
MNITFNSQVQNKKDEIEDLSNINERDLSFQIYIKVFTIKEYNRVFNLEPFTKMPQWA